MGTHAVRYLDQDGREIDVLRSRDPEDSRFAFGMARASFQLNRNLLPTGAMRVELVIDGLVVDSAGIP